MYEVPADLVSGESSVLGLQVFAFSLCPHVVDKVSGVSFYKTGNFIQEASTFMISLPPKGFISKCHHIGGEGFSMWF